MSQLAQRPQEPFEPSFEGISDINDALHNLPHGEVNAPGAPIELADVIGVVPYKKRLTPLERIKYAAGGIVVAAEVSPANEAVRGAIVLATAGATSSPIATAFAFGASTLVIEAAAAVAATPLLKSETASVGINGAHRIINNFSKSRLLKRFFYKEADEKFSKTTYAATALLGGSAVSMTLKTYENPDIEPDDLRGHGLKTALGLSAICGAAGLAGPEAVDTVTNNPNASLAVAAVAVGYAIVKKAKNVFERAKNPVEKWLDTDKFGINYGIVTNPEEIEKATLFEQKIWDELGYGNLEEEGYTDYFSQSQVIAAFEDGECIGMTRMFKDTDFPPPFIKSMPFYSEEERAKLVAMYQNREIEELGTAAVEKKYRHKDVNTHLWRIAYRDARKRGVQNWGIVMEPDRVERMNENYGFTFRQLGDVQDYQGGDCAAFIMNLDEVDKSMHDKKFIQHYWFTKLKLRASDK